MKLLFENWRKFALLVEGGEAFKDAIRYPIMGSDEYVQIDLMLSPNIRDTGWLMSGTGDEEVKGTFRNYLLNFVASLQRQPRSRITISYPGGFQRKELPQQFDPNDPKSKRKWQNVGEKNSNPEELLKALGINANPEEVNNFVDLTQHLLKMPKIAPRLKEFPEYIKNIPYNEEEKQKAINYLLSVI